MELMELQAPQELAEYLDLVVHLELVDYQV
jgi:hypothetical protein